MTTAEEAKAYVDEHIQIDHPDWKLTAEVIRDNISLTLTNTTHDSRPCVPPHRTIIVAHHRTMNAHLIRYSGDIKELVHRWWLECWAHEAREWFKVDGEILHDPHRR